MRLYAIIARHDTFIIYTMYAVGVLRGDMEGRAPFGRPSKIVFLRARCGGFAAAPSSQKGISRATPRGRPAARFKIAAELLGRAKRHMYARRSCCAMRCCAK